MCHHVSSKSMSIERATLHHALADRLRHVEDGIQACTDNRVPVGIVDACAGSRRVSLASFGQCSRKSSKPLSRKLTNSSFTPPTRSKYADGFTGPSSLNSMNAVATGDWCGMVGMQIQRPGTRCRCADVRPAGPGARAHALLRRVGDARIFAPNWASERFKQFPKPCSLLRSQPSRTAHLLNPCAPVGPAEH